MKIGAGVSKQLPEVLRMLNCSQPLLVTGQPDLFSVLPLLLNKTLKFICVTDNLVQKTGMIAPTEKILKEAGLPYHMFSGAIPDPTTTSLVPALQFMARNPQIDSVVGFGGGSSIDTAKALAVLVKNPGPLRRFKVPAEAPVGLPIIAIPTTAGTGDVAGSHDTIIVDKAAT